MSHRFNLNYGMRMEKADKLLLTVKTSTINCLTSMIFFAPINLVYNIIISGLKHLTQCSIDYLCILFTLNIIPNNSFYKDMA